MLSESDSERIDVMFHRANLLRRFDHLEKATPVFEEIVFKHPKHDAAEWSAQIVFDNYNRLQRYDAMFVFIDTPSQDARDCPHVPDAIGEKSTGFIIQKGSADPKSEVMRVTTIAKGS